MAIRVVKSLVANQSLRREGDHGLDRTEKRHNLCGMLCAASTVDQSRQPSRGGEFAETG